MKISYFLYKYIYIILFYLEFSWRFRPLGLHIYIKDIYIARRSLRKPLLLNVSIYWPNWFARLEYLQPTGVQLPERISPLGTIIDGLLKALEVGFMVPGSLRGQIRPPLSQENTTHRYVYWLDRHKIHFVWTVSKLLGFIQLFIQANLSEKKLKLSKEVK